MKPQGNGLIELHDDKKSDGFSCMKLIKFLSVNNDHTDWNAWHKAHIYAKDGKCLFKDRCEIYKRTKKT